jgi:hypothetical protein
VIGSRATDDEALHGSLYALLGEYEGIRETVGERGGRICPRLR